jgi:hypothetical protein
MKYIVNDDNFAQIIAEADDYINDLKNTYNVSGFDEGIAHIEKLLAVTDFLLEE